MVTKRIIIHGGYLTINELFVHIGTLLLFLILSLIYDKSKFATTYMPYVYALISYYSHTIFIFKGIFDSREDPSVVEMSKDNLFRHII